MGSTDASASFEVDLQDGTSGPAMSAVNALKQLHGQLDSDTKALAAMERAMRNLNRGSIVNIAQAKALREQMAQKKEAIAQAQSAILALGGGFDRAGRSGGKMGALLEQLTKQAQVMPGPLGGLVGRLSSLRGLVAGGAIALGIIAITAALVALTAAAAAAAVMLLKYGIAQADARRSEALRLEGLTKLRFWYRATADSAGALQTAVDEVAAGSALGRGELVKWTEQLYKMGLRGQNLKTTLEAVAIKASVQGDAYAQAFAGMAAGAAMTGHFVKKLADDVKARLGGIAAKQMLSLDVQSRKLHESFDALFRDLKVEGLLKALNMVTQLLSQNTATGRALKVLVETLFQPMINALETVAPLAKRFFQGMVIGALVLTIGILKVRNWFRKTFGDSEILKGLDMTKAALYAGVAVVSLLAAGAAMLALTFAAAAAPIIAVGAAFLGLVRAGQALVRWWQGMDWGALGRSIVDGIVNGLRNGAKWVIEAVKSLGTGAWAAFRKTLGIASPSKAFAKLGLALPQGVQVGIERGTPGVERSMGRMVDVPAEAAAPGRAAAPSSGAAAGPAAPSISLAVQELHVHAPSARPRDMAEELVSELERVLEGGLLSMGGAVPGGG